MALDESTFDSLVGGFYRAATGEIDWDLALEGVQSAFGARAAMLHTVDIRTGQIVALSQGGPPMHEGLLDYLREFHHIDPRRNHLMAQGEALLGRWWHCHEQFDERYVEADRFYSEFLPALQTRYQSTAVLRSSEHLLTGFAIELPAARGVLTAEERDWAERLGVHMQDALRAHQRVRRLAAQALAGHGLLQSFPYPMWLIDLERFVYFSNNSGHREVLRETRLALRDAHWLRLTDFRDELALNEHLHALRAASHGTACTLKLRQPAHDPPSWLHLSLLVPEAVFGAFGDRQLVLATLFDPQHVSRLDPFALSNLLALTPAQARVAVRLAEGLTAEQIAVAQGCSVATVRSHIRQLLMRTGAQRIAQLVRLLRQGEALWSACGGAGDMRSN